MKTRAFFLATASAFTFTGLGSGVVVTVHAEDHKHKTTYTCPMHPEVKTHAPGDCPICHMKLVPVKNAAEKEEKVPSPKGRKVKFYRNPMNPEITSPVPMKDSMGMEYLPVYESTEGSFKDAPLGRGSFDLSDEQAANVKLKTKKVEKKTLVEKLSVAARVASSSVIALQVLEADISKIKSGLLFEFHTLGSTSSYTGKIMSVDSALDPMSRTLRATGLISSRAGDLKLEQSGVATVSVSLGEGVAIPEEALLRTGKENLVYVVVADKKIVPRVVKLGAKIGDSYQILEGLREGEEISMGPNFLLDSEARMRGIHD